MGHSCSRTALILKEAIATAREAGKTAYVAFLDVQKAFDTVWHAGLLVKVYHKGVSGHWWHLINTWYSASTSCVLWNRTRLSSFLLKQGVRQGGLLSPFLYLVFNDELLDILTSSGVGVCIGSMYSGAPMYADNLALVSSSQTDLQAMLDTVNNYAIKWHYRLNESKSVFGDAAVTRKRERPTRREWKLGEAVLSEVDEIHHLGILRSVSHCRTNERVTPGRSAFFALNSIGSRFGCLHPLTSLKLYQTSCVESTH